MNRPSWSPADADPEQRALAERVIASFKAVEALEERAWQDFIAAKRAGVPVTWMVERIKPSRATVYRKLDELGEPRE